MNPIRHIRYERGDAGYQINIYAPTEKFPLYQITCNDPDCGFSGTVCCYEMEDVDKTLCVILRNADDWEEIAS